VIDYFEHASNEDKKKHSIEMEEAKEIKLTIEDKEFVLTEKHLSFKHEDKN
jgi:hypothetical protein